MIRIPEACLEYMRREHLRRGREVRLIGTARICAEAMAKWLAEFPIVPTDEQLVSLDNCDMPLDTHERWRKLIVDWQRSMFDADRP